MKRKYFIALIFAGILVALYFFHPFLLTNAAKYLIVEDKLEKADLIIVLGGDTNGERVDQGVALYKKGYAGRMLMSGGPLYRDLTYAQLMKKQAVKMGIPSAAILTQDESRSTKEDAKYSFGLFKKYKIKSIILVTSPTHSRRAGSSFRKLLAQEKIKVIIYPAQKSEFKLARWWTRHEDTGAVVWEYVAMVLYFLKGF